jgi:1-acyl-sn-glycerol-3-phosphate acyltransferase
MSSATTANELVLERRSRLQDVLQAIFFACFVRPFTTLFIGLRVRNRERLPGDGPFIVVANHSSHLDTVTLLNLFPVRRLYRIRPVAAADYFERNVYVSAFSRTFFNILPIARKQVSAEENPVDRMDAALRAGYSLILFPEGTRGSGGQVGKFKTGAARVIERNPGVPVIPAYLVNMGRSLPKGEWFPLPFFCEVRIGEPLTLTGDKHEMTDALEKAVASLRDS